MNDFSTKVFEKRKLWVIKYLKKKAFSFYLTIDYDRLPTINFDYYKLLFYKMAKIEM